MENPSPAPSFKEQLQEVNDQIVGIEREIAAYDQSTQAIKAFSVSGLALKEGNFKNHDYSPKEKALIEAFVSERLSSYVAGAEDLKKDWVDKLENAKAKKMLILEELTKVS